jgi:hypothetical protein
MADDEPTSLVNDPHFRETARNLMAMPGLRVFHPALVLDIVDLAASFLRVAKATLLSWQGVADEDVEAMASYLTSGPNDRIPDDETALAMMLSIVALVQHAESGDAGYIS